MHAHTCSDAGSMQQQCTAAHLLSPYHQSSQTFAISTDTCGWSSTSNLGRYLLEPVDNAVLWLSMLISRRAFQECGCSRARAFSCRVCATLQQNTLKLLRPRRRIGVRKVLVHEPVVEQVEEVAQITSCAETYTHAHYIGSLRVRSRVNVAPAI